jgi:hypothetical protein
MPHVFINVETYTERYTGVSGSMTRPDQSSFIFGRGGIHVCFNPLRAVAYDGH